MARKRHPWPTPARGGAGGTLLPPCQAHQNLITVKKQRVPNSAAKRPSLTRKCSAVSARTRLSRRARAPPRNSRRRLGSPGGAPDRGGRQHGRDERGGGGAGAEGGEGHHQRLPQEPAHVSRAFCAAGVVGGGPVPRSSPLAAAARAPRALPTGGARLGLSRRASWPLPGRVAGGCWEATSESHVGAWSFLPCRARPGSCDNSSPGRPPPGRACSAGHRRGLCAWQAALGGIPSETVEGHPPHQTPHNPLSGY